MKTLSVIMPVYNEARTIEAILKAVEQVSLPDLAKEIVIVDDFSTDGTREFLKSLGDKNKIIFKEKNEGKGSAVREGLRHATGDIVIIQDADLEYDPREFPLMLEPILEGKADVVYGSRFLGHRPHRVLYFWHYVGNRLFTTLSNMLSNINLTDMETCYKAFTRPVAVYLAERLTSKRFGLEPEITALVAKKKYAIYEVGISYSGRTYEEGKKINWKDGLAAAWHIIRFNLF